MNELTDLADHRVRRVARDGWDDGHGSEETYETLCANWKTSMADARAARSIAYGVPIENIDPATGNEHSARVYVSHRRGWQRSYDRAVLGVIGSDPDELLGQAEECRREFLAKRPDLDDGLPWIRPAVTAKTL